MNIDTTILSNYLNQKACPSTYTWVYEFTKGTQDIQMHRQDVVHALLEQLYRYQEECYPLWNHKIQKAIFQDDLQLVNAVEILPIVGSNSSFDCTICSHAAKTYLLIDLLNVADYTRVLSEMQYILHNLIHVHLCRYLIQQRYPKKPLSYIEQLENMFFVDGLAQYVAWNAHMEHCHFQDSMYKKRKETAFAMLYEAMQLQDEGLQQSILKRLNKISFWDKFPQAAGMFFLDDLYFAEKEKGLRAFYIHGPNAILSIVFHI